MNRAIAIRVLFAAALLGVTSGSTRPALAAPFCASNGPAEFRAGIAQLSAALGQVMGEPKECEHPHATIGTIQTTTTGLAFIRKLDGVVGFTDGQQQWLSAAEGVAVTPVDHAREAGSLRALPMGLANVEKCAELGRLDRATDDGASVWPTKVEVAPAFPGRNPYMRVPTSPTGAAWFVGKIADQFVFGMAWRDDGVTTAIVVNGVAVPNACSAAYLSGYRGAAIDPADLIRTSQPAALTPATAPVPPAKPQPPAPPPHQQPSGQPAVRCPGGGVPGWMKLPDGKEIPICDQSNFNE